MPNLLGVTNPVPGQDTANINRQLPVNPSADTRVQNAPSLDRVSRPDNRTERQDSGDAAGPGGSLRYDSNFSTFLQKLRDTPGLTQTFSRVLAEYRSIVSSGMDEGIAGEMGQLLEMVPMDEQQLLQFLTQQLADSARFSGPLFTILREAYAQSQTQNIKTDILQFLKRYGDYTSTEHIEGNLLRTLSQLSRAIPGSYSRTLTALTQQLQQLFQSGDRAGALKLLQGGILGHLANYTETTHDMGLSRSLISQLALEISRYENGSEEGLTQAFSQLTGHEALKARLGSLNAAALLNSIRNSAFSRAPAENQFANQLARAADMALRGSGGAEAQEAFRQILQALLINESVYMPLNHIILPMEWNGKLMFSELWVDPDAEDNLHKGGSQKDNTLRFLLKVDIQGLGFFDIVMGSRGDEVEMLISCPATVAPFSQLIQSELSRILTENGLRPNGIQVVKMERPLTLSAVFPKIFEGENSVNVQI